MFRNLGLFCLILITIIPTKANSLDFGVSEGDQIEYTLLQSRQAQSVNSYQIQGLNGTLLIFVGDKFMVSPTSLDILYDAKYGEYLPIEIIWEDLSIAARSQLSGDLNFFIKMDWDEFRGQHIVIDFTTNNLDSHNEHTVSMIETEAEIGFADFERTDYGNVDDPNHSWNSIYVTARYSKTNGARNYYFRETHNLDISMNGDVYNVSTVLEYSRSGYTLTSPENTRIFKIEWSTLSICGILLIPIAQKYRRRLDNVI